MIPKFELFLGFTIKKPKIPHSHCLQALALNGVVNIPRCYDVVNVKRGWGWEWPNSCRESHIAFVSCELRKGIPSSTSMAYVAKKLRIMESMWMAPLR